MDTRPQRSHWFVTDEGHHFGSGWLSGTIAAADLFKDRKERKHKGDEPPPTRTNWEAFQRGQQVGDKIALTSGALTA
jgi:hypothetical protein